MNEIKKMASKPRVTYDNSPSYHHYTSPSLEAGKTYECSADIEFDSITARKLSLWERLWQSMLRIIGKERGR